MILGPNPLAPARPQALPGPQPGDPHPNRPPPSLRVPSGTPLHHRTPPQPTRNSPAPLPWDQPQRSENPPQDQPGLGTPTDTPLKPPQPGNPPPTHVQHLPLRHDCDPLSATSATQQLLPAPLPTSGKTAFPTALPPLIGATSHRSAACRLLLAASAVCQLAPPTTAVPRTRDRRYTAAR